MCNKNMFSPSIQFYIHSFLLTSTAVSIWIIILPRCLCRSSRFISHRPVCFFSKFWLSCNSCIQSSGLTGVIIIIPFSLLERRGRRNSNKSRNSLLLNRIANFSYLFFVIRLFDYVPTWYELFSGTFFFLSQLLILPTTSSRAGLSWRINIEN